jgi:glycosyltransferase involved in cell wall biosynthesis
MKIGFDAKRAFHNTTGLGNYSRDLIRILSEYYPENQYVLYNPKKPHVDRLHLTDQMQIKMPSGYWSKKLTSVWRSRWLVNDAVKDKIDIFHGLSGELPVGINKTNIKTVVTIHDLIFLRFPELYHFIDRKIYTTKFKSAAKNADKIVAISQATKQDVVHFFDINPEKIDVIYQGCHHIFKQSFTQNDKLNVINKYKLPHEFLLNVGTIEPRKNAFNIVKAIKDSNYQLVLVGRKTKYAKQIEAYILKHNMQNRVHFLQGLSLKELAILYQQARVFLYPSIYEGFGIPIIEALYSKTPVITNKYGVFKEAAGPYSYYVEDVNDPVQIKEKIDEAWQSKYTECVNKSYEFVQKFNDNVIADNWINLYQKLQH